MTTPTNLASMVAEIKALIFVNGVGGITASVLQQVLIDTLNVLNAIATSAAQAEADAEITAATPGLLMRAGQSGTAAAQAALPGIQQAAATSATAAASPFVAQAATYASSALASANAAATFVQSFFNDGTQGDTTVVTLDDGIQQ